MNGSRVNSFAELKTRGDMAIAESRAAIDELHATLVLRAEVKERIDANTQDPDPMLS
jgi:hypothetical protein